MGREALSVLPALNLCFALFDWCARRLPAYALCSVRGWLYRTGGCAISPGVTIQGPLLMLSIGPPAERLQVGQGSIVAPLVTFGLDADVTIGQNVSVGPGTAFHTATHAIGFASRRMQLPVIAQPIVVEDGAWIGAGCLILPGVTVGRGSILAAGSVLVESLPANTFASGNPAQIHETLPFGNR
jgi:acetyltransferase-like isoleucine patch superfamily enzyme